MDFWSNCTMYGFSWPQVATALWRRYPNPYSSHILTTDTVEQRCEGSKLYTKRLIVKRGKIPAIIKKFVGDAKNLFSIEESVVDLETNTVTTYTRNINAQNVLSIQEKCVYKQVSDLDNTDSNYVTCLRFVWSTSDVSTFRQFVASYGIKHYQKHMQNTVKGFNYVLDRMYNPEFDRRVYSQCQDRQRRVNYLLQILLSIQMRLCRALFQPNFVQLAIHQSDSSVSTRHGSHGRL